MRIAHNQTVMTIAQFLPTEGSRTYVIGTHVPADSGVLTVADVLSESSEKSLLGDDPRQSDSHEPAPQAARDAEPV
jgi:hypothetical protein